MRRFLFIVLCWVGALLLRAQAAEINGVEFRGHYLGQELPGHKPQVFAPDLFSIWGSYGFHLQTSIVFSPTGRELFFTNHVLPSVRGRSCSILYMERTNDLWTEPRLTSFSSDYSDSGVFFSSDGRVGYFMSTRPSEGRGGPKDADIWFVEKRGGGWSAAEPITPPVNGPFNDIGGGVAANGTMFFSSDRPGGKGSFDIYSARFFEGSYADPQNLGEAVNTHAAEYAVCIAPDSSFLIFCRNGSTEKENTGLYVTFRTVDNNWTRARSMGDHIIGLNASGASISPDGRYLFIFGNGDGMYWLSTDLIEYLKTADLDISDALLRSLFHSGMSAALLTYYDLKQKHAKYVDIDEFLLNQRGYQFLQANKIKEAIGLFSISVAISPDSWNAYDSLGEAYLAAGEIESAMVSYRRSLELNPDNQNAIDVLKALEKR